MSDEQKESAVSVEAGISELSAWDKKTQGYKELAFFLMFFALYICVQVLQQGEDSFIVNSSLRAALDGYKDVQTPEQFWGYVEGLVTTVFPDAWYNGQALPTEELGYLSYYNKLVGGVQITQTRAGAVNCTGSIYSSFYGACHNGPTPTSFGGPDGDRFQAANGTTDYILFLSVAMSQKSALAELGTAKDGLWIDKATKSVTIKFSTYNGEARLFSFAVLYFHFGKGGIFNERSAIDIQSANLELYNTQRDYIRLGLELLLVFFIFSQISAELLDFYDSFGHYFSSAWNYLDVLSMSLLVAYVVLRMRYVIFIFENPIVLPSNRYEPAVEESATILASLLLVNSLSILIAIARLFKYFEFQPRMNIISMTVERSFSDMVHFMILFFLIFLGYCSMALILFGPHLLQFSSIGRCVQSMAEIILGAFDFEPLREINSLLAAIMFWTFIIVGFFLMVNVFLAILIDAYVEAKEESKGAVSILSDFQQWASRTWIAVRDRHEREEDPMVCALEYFQNRGLATVTATDVRWYLETECGMDKEVVNAQLTILRCLPGQVDEEEEDNSSLTMESLMKSAWIKYDRDSSGSLSRDEFTEFMRDGPIKVEEYQIAEIMKKADRNHDNQISFDEFVPLFTALLVEGMRSGARG